ncbi:MAG: universal stress protein [Rhodobacteraceae bacterium]|nr:universal stress protein [Paracoccaceae bacterium]
MTRHIFVATDGSQTATKAIDMAGTLAAKLGVPLTIGHVLQFGQSSAELARLADVEKLVEHVSRETKVDFQVLTGGSGDILARTRPGDDSVRVVTAVGDEILRRAATQAREQGAETVSTTSTDGDVADGIMDMAQKAGADMIVVGHRGLGRMKTALLGSVAHKVVQHAPCTVVSVR